MLNSSKQDILIVDDDKNICEIFSEYCTDLKLFNKVIIAHDGSLAQQKLQNQEFGLMVVDINMPKKNGLELVTNEFRAGTRHKKEHVLFVSGSLDQELITRLIKTGFHNFLVKPVDEEAFKAKIKKMLGILNPQ
jgi:response regulator of citrate/malate metabolism